MKKTKRVLSIILALMMSISTLSAVSITAFADSFEKQAKSINWNTTYTDQFTKNTAFYYKDAAQSYYLTLPVDGTVTVHIESKTAKLFEIDALYSSLKLKENEYLWSEYIGDDCKYNYETSKYYFDIEFALAKGSYYYVRTYSDTTTYTGNYSITFDYKVDVSAPTSMSVSSRNSYSMNIAWNNVADVDGYELQANYGGGYQAVTETSNNSYYFSDLAAAKTYYFRVRAYKTVSGTRYYSDWKALGAATVPNRVSINTPSTNKKHQIIAKWSKQANVSGYQIQYSRNKGFSSVIATKTASASKSSVTGKNFTKGKKYYVRVRSYKTVNGAKNYGAWSAVKGIKCK